jgi:hypothetical protein
MLGSVFGPSGFYMSVSKSAPLSHFHEIEAMKSDQDTHTTKRSKHKESGDKSVKRAAKDEESRRRKKELRRKEKLKAYFAELGLDENGEKLDNFSLLKYPVREWIVTIPGTTEPIALNPVVTLIGIGCLCFIICWSSGTLPTWMFGLAQCYAPLLLFPLLSAQWTRKDRSPLFFPWKRESSIPLLG